MIKIFVTEEYGYRYWFWLFPGSEKELKKEWREGRTPLVYPRYGKCLGKIISIKQTKRILSEISSAKYQAHIHEPWDTVLSIGNSRYRVPEGKEDEEELFSQLVNSAGER